MINAEIVKAVHRLLQRSGIEQREGEPLGDYVARGLGVSAAKARVFLEAMDSGCSAYEAQRLAGISDTRMLVRLSRAVGIALAKINRRSVRVPEIPKSRAPGPAGATEEQVSMSGQVPQRIDGAGTKVEDIAGTGVHDSQGG